MTTTDVSILERELAESFVAHDVRAAAHVLASSPVAQIARHLEEQKVTHAAALLEAMEPNDAAESIARMQDDPTRRVLSTMNPVRLAPLLARLDEPVREQKLQLLDESLAQELRSIISYPPDTAGHLMDPRFVIFPATATVRDVTRKLKSLRKRRVLDVPLADEEGRLAGLIPLQEVILAEPGTLLRELVNGEPPSIHAMAPREDVVDLLSSRRLTSLPVVDLDGHVLGMIRHNQLVQAVREEVSADLQKMVGVGAAERALSSPFFSVRKRLPWLNINLLTAFLAAAVVGLFENIIAQVTALAVLLPVVAGQSGNTGAQALAVTMRGLALREIRPGQWPRVLLKEAVAGALNGVAIAVVTSLGVLLWSQSIGLTLVIGVSMVISMCIAGMSGAAIPLLLSAAGQDPAQSSSILLTTVTDVMGFFSFLGLATLFVQFL